MPPTEEVSRTSDQLTKTVDSTSKIDRTALLAQSKLSTSDTSADTQKYVDDKVLPKVTLSSTSDGKTEKTNKTEKSDADKSDDKPKVELWGGDEKSPKVRHKPMSVAIEKDGTGTVEVKYGDTAWDVARRTLEEEGKRANPPHKPSNKEIYEKLKELEKLNGGRNLGILRPGDKIKISAEDVKATRDSKADKSDGKTDSTSSNTKDNGDGTTTTTSKAGDKTYAVTRNKDGDPVKVEITDGQGNKHVYEPNGQNGSWTCDGQPTKDGSVGIGFNHGGQFVVRESEGNEVSIAKNGTVVETTNGKQKVTTPDGTTYQEEADGSYTKTTPQGEKSKIEGANFRIKGGVVSENAKAEIEEENKKALAQQEEEAKKKEQQKQDVQKQISDIPVDNPK